MTKRQAQQLERELLQDRMEQEREDDLRSPAIDEDLLDFMHSQQEEWKPLLPAPVASFCSNQTNRTNCGACKFCSSL